MSPIVRQVAPRATAARRISRVALAAAIPVCALLLAAQRAPRTHGTPAAGALPHPVVADQAQDLAIRGHAVHADPPRPELVPPYLAMLRAELAHYPLAAWPAMQLKRIVVTDKLTSGGVAFDAMADWDAHVLYLTALDLAREEHHARLVIHHEAYHLLDQAQTGDLASDAAWAGLNTVGFAYGSGGDSMRQLGTGDVGSTDLPGFVSNYATTGVDEDKAETYAHLIEDRGWVVARMARDGVLASKVALLRQRLSAYVPGWGERI